MSACFMGPAVFVSKFRGALHNGERDKMIANALENSSRNGISNDDFRGVVETVVNGKRAKDLMANPLKKKAI